MLKELTDAFFWWFTPLGHNNFVNCFGDQPCYQEPFGLLPMPVSIVALVALIIFWRKGWLKSDNKITEEKI